MRGRKTLIEITERNMIPVRVFIVEPNGATATSTPPASPAPRATHVPFTFSFTGGDTELVNDVTSRLPPARSGGSTTLPAR